MSTTPGIGPGGWDSSKLATSQDIQFYSPKPVTVGFRLYTEDSDGLRESLVRLVARYFEGATITHGVGLWQGKTERAAVVDIIGTLDDVQAIANLAGDIRFVHGQAAVLVTWSPITQLLITGDAS